MHKQESMCLRQTSLHLPGPMAKWLGLFFTKELETMFSGWIFFSFRGQGICAWVNFLLGAEPMYSGVGLPSMGQSLCM